MIFQNFGLLAQKTVLANVCFPFLAANGKVTPENRDRALELLEMVDLKEKASSYPLSALWWSAAARSYCPCACVRPGVHLVQMRATSALGSGEHQHHP